MNVNLRGTFFCCRAGFKHMKKQGGGTHHQHVERRGRASLGRHGHL